MNNFNDYAFYGDPSSSSSSIPGTTNKASKGNHCNVFQQKVVIDYTWRNTASKLKHPRLTKKYYMKSEI